MQDMRVSYAPLWRMLKKKNMRKEDLRLKAALTTNTIANMGRNGNIQMSTLVKICSVLGCGIGDVVELVQEPTSHHTTPSAR